MSYDPSANGISGANDVALNNPANNDALSYSSSLGKWQNAAITKSTIGLGNVNNTSDDNKPISTATQSALDAKVTLSSIPSTSSIPAFVKWNGTAWPARSTATSSNSIVVFYIGGSVSPTDMQAGDIWLREG